MARWAWLPLAVVAYAGLALEAHWLSGASWAALTEYAMFWLLALPFGLALGWGPILLVAWLSTPHKRRP